MTNRMLLKLKLGLIAGMLLGGPAAAELPESAGHQLRHCNGDMAHSSGDHPAPEIGLTVRPETVRAGERAILNFLLCDPDGAPLDAALLTHHARRLHVVIVGQDMKTFGHIHPHDFAEPIVNGRATVRFEFPQGGRYLVAADIMTEHGPHSEHFIIDVAGAGRAEGSTTRLSVVETGEGDRYTAAISFDEVGSTDGYEILMFGTDLVRAGVPARFSWAVERHGRPVTDLRPFLDAPLHLAVVKDDLSRFLHEHGEAAEPPVGRQAASLSRASEIGAHGSTDHAHGHLHRHGSVRVPQSFGPDLEATVTFPEPGLYIVFAQAAHEDKMLVLRFPVLVE